MLTLVDAIRLIFYVVTLSFVFSNTRVDRTNLTIVGCILLLIIIFIAKRRSKDVSLSLDRVPSATFWLGLIGMALVAVAVVG
jgi:hypothetical protein